MPDNKEWIEMAKVVRNSIHNRRALEWKLAFGFWVAIAAFTSAAHTWGTDFNKCVLGGIYIFVLATTVVCWKIPLQQAHAGDGAYFKFYMDMARGNNDKPDVEVDETMKGRNILWLVGQGIFSAMFLLASWYLLT